MVKIRVTCGGCGIEYTDEHGNARHALKTAEDGPFLCDAKQAERLVGLGVAAYVTTKEPETAEGDQDPGATSEVLSGVKCHAELRDPGDSKLPENPHGLAACSVLCDCGGYKPTLRERAMLGLTSVI